MSIFERPGTPLSGAMQREVDKHFVRQEARRVPFDEVGSISYPARAGESYADALLSMLEADPIRERHFRIVVDYGASAASAVLPLVLGPLGVESVSAHPFASDSTARPLAFGETIDEARRLVAAVGADLAVIFDRAGERLYLVDERGAEVPPETVLLLYLRLLVVERSPGPRGRPRDGARARWTGWSATRSRSCARRPRCPRSRTPRHRRG